MRPRLPSNLLAVLHDLAMALVSFGLALWLRRGANVALHAGLYFGDALIFALVLLAVLLYFRIYRRVWSYTSLNDLLVLARAGTLALGIFYPLLFALNRMDAVPRSIPFIHWLTLMLCLASGRVLARVARDRALLARITGRRAPQVPVLLIGATPQAEMFIRESERSFAFPYRAEGILDDDARRRGRAVHHVRIWGGIPEVESVLAKLKSKGRAVQRILITEPSLPRGSYETLLAAAQAHRVTLARLPSLTELQAGSAMRDVQPVAVEDILGRAQAVLDRDAMRRFVAGRRVLVTGAGGSIGSELVRQLIALSPAELLLYEQSEYLLYRIGHALEEQEQATRIRAVLGDVRDASQLERVFSDFRPELVFHAAAIKHVPLGEANPAVTVLTNVLGSKLVADACIRHGVAAMVQVSTDKAVNPASVMGASKRVAEIYCQAVAEGRRGDALHHRALRQRAGLGGLGGAAVPEAAQARRADHRHRPRDDALLHDHRRGGGPRAAGGLPRRGGRRVAGGACAHLRARHGRAGQHHRPRRADGAPRRAGALQGRCHRLHRRAQGREAPRGAFPQRRGLRRNAA